MDMPSFELYPCKHSTIYIQLVTFNSIPSNWIRGAMEITSDQEAEGCVLNPTVCENF